MNTIKLTFSNKKWLYGLVSILVIFLLGISSITFASEDSEDYVLEETVVTATKTGETKLQETPIAITAIDTEELKVKSAFNLFDLSELSPNTQVWAVGGDTTVYIRGIGSQGVFFIQEPNVGFYLDGVPLERGLAASTDFVDVERIEILRGPQGTMYGRNATGGAINIITRKPTDELAFTASLEADNFDKVRFDASIAGPLVADKINGRLTVTAGKWGTQYDVVAGAKIDDSNLIGGRGVLDFKISDTIDFTLRADYMKDELNTIGGKNLDSFVQLGFYEVDTNLDFVRIRDRVHSGVSGHLKVNLGNMTLSSITAYRKLDETMVSDEIAVPVDVIDSDVDIETFSQELQFNASWDRLNWNVGLFYYHMKDSEFNQSWKYNLFNWWTGEIIPMLYMGFPQESTTDSYAIYTNLDYKVTDKFTMGAGLRYSYEEKEAFSHPVEIPVLYYFSQLDVSDDWSDVSPKLVAEYKINNEAMIYGSLSKGFRPGNFASQNRPPSSQYLEPEINWSYEIGGKTTWLDKRLRINAAAFYSKYEDMQLYSVVDNLMFQNNAAKAVIQGVEIEVIALLSPALTLNFNGGYVNAEYDEYVNMEGVFPFLHPVDLSGNRMPYVPELNLNIGAQYVFDLGNSGFITLRGDANYKGDVYFNAFNVDLFSQDSFWLFKAFARYETADGHWSLEAYGKNLADEEYYQTINIAIQGWRTGEVAYPATYGVRLVYNY